MDSMLRYLPPHRQSPHIVTRLICACCCCHASRPPPRPPLLPPLLPHPPPLPALSSHQGKHKRVPPLKCRHGLTVMGQQSAQVHITCPVGPYTHAHAGASICHATAASESQLNQEPACRSTGVAPHRRCISVNVRAAVSMLTRSLAACRRSVPMELP